MRSRPDHPRRCRLGLHRPQCVFQWIPDAWHRGRSGGRYVLYRQVPWRFSRVVGFLAFERRNSMNFKNEVVLFSLFVAMLGVLSGIPAAEAQTTIGGHVGFVLPLVTHAGGQTTNIADNFSIGFPLGVTFEGTGRMAYDLELVPGVQGTPRLTTFTRHLLQGVFRRGRAAGPLQS